MDFVSHKLKKKKFIKHLLSHQNIVINLTSIPRSKNHHDTKEEIPLHNAFFIDNNC